MTFFITTTEWKPFFSHSLMVKMSLNSTVYQLWTVAATFHLSFWPLLVLLALNINGITLHRFQLEYRFISIFLKKKKFCSLKTVYHLVFPCLNVDWHSLIWHLCPRLKYWRTVPQLTERTDRDTSYSTNLQCVASWSPTPLHCEVHWSTHSCLFDTSTIRNM